jgi:hypothetical protein
MGFFFLKSLFNFFYKYNLCRNFILVVCVQGSSNGYNKHLRKFCYYCTMFFDVTMGLASKVSGI